MSENHRSRFTLTEGSSDKEYIIQLSAEGDGFVLRTFHGRRGSTLTETVKTKSPVSYEVGLKAYEKAVKERLGKRYTPDGDGSDMVGAGAAKEMTDLLPQLLNPIAEADVESYINSPSWVMQEKHDGNRRGFHCTNATTISANREGFKVGYPSEVGDSLTTAFSALFPLKVDGELMGTDFVVFDVREISGVNLDSLSVEGRLEHMERLRAELKASGVSNVRVVITARTTDEKRALFERLKAAKREGFVAKRLDAPYEPGKPASGGSHLKFKFVKDATVIVLSNHATKSSIGIGMLDDEGNVVAVGNCTIPANHSTPEVGALVDVQYLYAYKGGSLYQPVYQRPRDDIARKECTLSTLHYKPETNFDDEDEAA